MGRNHKPRKRYVPKRVDPDPISLAASGAALLSPDQRQALMLPALQTLDALRTGRGNEAVWSAMVDVLNIAEALVGLQIGTNLGEEIDAAQLVLLHLLHRANAGRGWTLYAEELRTLTYAVELYEIQIDHCSTGEHLEAVQRVIRQSRGARTAAANAHLPAHITLVQAEAPAHAAAAHS